MPNSFAQPTPVFCLPTGMRMSDVKNFDMEQVKGKFIILNPIKNKAHHQPNGGNSIPIPANY